MIHLGHPKYGVYIILGGAYNPAYVWVFILGLKLLLVGKSLLHVIAQNMQKKYALLFFFCLILVAFVKDWLL